MTRYGACECGSGSGSRRRWRRERRPLLIAKNDDNGDEKNEEEEEGMKEDRVRGGKLWPCVRHGTVLPLPSGEERGLYVLHSLAADLRSFVNVPQNSPMERFRIPPPFLSFKRSLFLKFFVGGAEEGNLSTWHPFLSSSSIWSLTKVTRSHPAAADSRGPKQ